MSVLAEQNVIGSLLMNNDCISEVYNKLLPEMFSNKLLGLIYSEFCKGFENNYSVNLVILDEKIDQEISRETLMQSINACIDVTTTSAEIKSCAESVVRSYKARKLNDILHSTIPKADGIDEQISNLIQTLEELQNTEQSTSHSLAEITKMYKDQYFIHNENEKIYLGFSALDNMLCGLEGGDMIVIGARPAVGKSAFVTQISTNLANEGKKIGFYSLEMPEKQMYERFVAQESGIEVQRIRRGTDYKNDEEERFNKANRSLERRDNVIITTGGKSVSEIRAECRHADYDLIIIDYLQLLKPDSTYRGNRTAEVGQISHAIKNLAMELNIPIIALSQLNRVSESRENKEPTMSELRESGDVEQDASVIMLLWNKSHDDKGLKGCKVEKQRQGITGTVTMRFSGETMKFEEVKENDGFEYGYGYGSPFM